jgi:ribonucleotide reductase alpha subunit
MKQVIDMAADRGAFICQSQSLNLWMEDPDYKALTSMHFYAWQAGLKTGMYYLRRKPKHQPQQFTINPASAAGTASASASASAAGTASVAGASASAADTVGLAEKEEEICEMCSS